MLPLLRPDRRLGTKRKPFYPRQECATLSVALSLPHSLASLFFLSSTLRAGLSRLPHSSETMDGTGVLLPQHEMISPSPDLMCTFKAAVCVGVGGFVCVGVCVCVERDEQENSPHPSSPVAMEFLLRDNLSLPGRPAPNIYCNTHTHTHSLPSRAHSPWQQGLHCKHFLCSFPAMLTYLRAGKKIL